jgi:hypothetical protein
MISFLSIVLTPKCGGGAEYKKQSESAHSFSSHVSPLGRFCCVTSGSLRSVGAAFLGDMIVDLVRFGFAVVFFPFL